MKNGFYIEYSLIGFGGTNRKTKVIQEMAPHFCKSRGEVQSFINGMKKHLKTNDGNYRKMKKVKIFKVKREMV